MEQEQPLGFLDVPLLLETSKPQPRVPWIWFVAGGGVLLMIVLSVTDHSGGGNVGAQLAAMLLSMVIFLAMPLMLRLSLRKIRAEQQAVQTVGELVQLRRWPEAAFAVQQILLQPTHAMQLRSEALVYLASLLARYHRFDDAIAVHDHLLDNDLVSPGTAYAVKLGRAMGMLREDHLFDADRAISDLRRLGPTDSAGFALVDMYRDVKTGHPDDALKIFEDKLPALRTQLGHRLADAYALAARAYDLLERKAEAAHAFRRATLLAPLMELCRRYPEVEKLVGRYDPAPAPIEMA